MNPLIFKHYFTKKTILIITTVACVCACLLYWQYSKTRVSTNNSYINANIVQIAPRISGQVRHLSIQNNQYVTQGQLLFEVDPTPYTIAVNEAKAQLSKSEAAWIMAQHTEKRTLKLLEKHVASEQQGDSAETDLRAAQASIELAKANLDKALLDLNYTKITAPTSGWVTNVTVREGSIIEANQPLFALISDQEFWIDANFKETEISQIHSGQTATISIDMYQGHRFKGTVESISGGSGTVFSLLPPQNATGNWVKVTQRVPVRIRIDTSDKQFPLRIGTSATVSVYTG